MDLAVGSAGFNRLISLSTVTSVPCGFGESNDTERIAYNNGNFVTRPAFPRRPRQDNRDGSELLFDL